MKQLLILLLSIVPICLPAQNVKFEQKAFDYFFENLFEEKYANVKEVQFNGCTERELTEFGLFTDCFKGDSTAVWETLYDQAHGKIQSPVSIDISKVSQNIKFRKSRGKSKIRLHVMQTTMVEDKAYVMIGLVKPEYYTHAYFFELDKNGLVSRWCQTGITH